MIGTVNDKLTFLGFVQPGEVKMPFLENSCIKAGFPSPAEDYLQNEIDLNKLLIKHPAATFLIQSTGDSMKDAGIADPSRLFVDRAIQPRSGDIIMACVNGEFTIKYFKRKGDRVILEPANEKYNAIEIVDGMTFSVVGVITWILIDPRKSKR